MIIMLLKSMMLLLLLLSMLLILFVYNKEHTLKHTPLDVILFYRLSRAFVSFFLSLFG